MSGSNPPAWSPPPEPLTWTLASPIEFGSASYSTVTLRAPTAGEAMKATAVRGASNIEVSLRLISAVSLEGIPYEALQKLPAWLVEQMTRYMDAFTGAPQPDPLEHWYRTLREASAP